MSLRNLVQAGGMRAFRHRNFRLWYTGQTISLIGTWMQSVAQSWLVLELTGDPFWLGVVTAAQFLPILALGLFGGVVADAVPKRPALVVTQSVMMVLAFVLFGLVASGAVEVWMVLGMALLLGLVNSVDMPVRQAFAIEMVGREDITTAVALNSAIFNGARVVGPAVAGLVIAATGVAAAFLVNGLTFVAVIVALLAMRPAELMTAPPVARPRTVREVGTALGEGLGYVRRTPVVLLALLVVGLTSTFGFNFQVLVPPYARDVLGLGAEGFGFLMAASGIGSLTAALWLAFAGTPRPTRMAAGALLLGVMLLALGATAFFGLAMVLMTLAGFGAITMLTSGNATIQIVVPDGLRGRVMSVYGTVFIGSSPFGSLLIGAVASAAGVGPAFMLSGGVTVAVALAAGAWFFRTDAGRAARRMVAAAVAGPGTAIEPAAGAVRMGGAAMVPASAVAPSSSDPEAG